METWEIVLILVLVTIALIVLANHNVSLGFIHLLDNSLFQLAIVGLTLAVAVASPAVGIVAIATIVIVYYVRNLIKVQLINTNESPMIVEEEANQHEPRLIVEETHTVETTTQHIEVDNNHAAHGSSSECKLNTKDEDEDVVEAALKEHEGRVTLTSSQMFGKNFKIPAPAPVPDSKPLDQDDFPNPRSTEGFQADSSDPLAETHGGAPHAGTPTYVPQGTHKFADDANIFTPGSTVPDGFNEAGAQPTLRPYTKSDGQYGIAEQRPYSVLGKYETADYIPGREMGENDFKQWGVSIDDKITNLRNGIVVGNAPPPNFDVVDPQPSYRPSR
jgi:hypothetical protein